MSELDLATARQELMKEFGKVHDASNVSRTPITDALLAVARHVLANPARWQRVLGMDIPAAADTAPAIPPPVCRVCGQPFDGITSQQAATLLRYQPHLYRHADCSPRRVELNEQAAQELEDVIAGRTGLSPTAPQDLPKATGDWPRRVPEADEDVAGYEVPTVQARFSPDPGTNGTWTIHNSEHYAAQLPAMQGLEVE